MKQNRIPLLIVVAAFAALAILTSCASPPAPTPQPQETTQATQETAQPAMVFPQGLVFFAPNIGDFGGISTATKRDNDAVLRLVTDYLKANPGASVRIEGHANPTTPPGTRERTAENPELLRLSEQRARTVMDALVSMGVDRSRLSIVGFGGSRIVVVFEDRANWHQNRRVEFVTGR